MLWIFQALKTSLERKDINPSVINNLKNNINKVILQFHIDSLQINNIKINGSINGSINELKKQLKTLSSTDSLKEFKSYLRNNNIINTKKMNVLIDKTLASARSAKVLETEDLSNYILMINKIKDSENITTVENDKDIAFIFNNENYVNFSQTGSFKMTSTDATLADYTSITATTNGATTSNPVDQKSKLSILSCESISISPSSSSSEIDVDSILNIINGPRNDIELHSESQNDNPPVDATVNLNFNNFSSDLIGEASSSDLNINAFCNDESLKEHVTPNIGNEFSHDVESFEKHVSPIDSSLSCCIQACKW